jgi:TonB family protein
LNSGAGVTKVTAEDYARKTSPMRQVITAAVGLLVLSCTEPELIAPLKFNVPPPPVSPSDVKLECVFIESPPTFPGGHEALHDFIKRNLEYPQARCWEGKVFVAFIVDKDGSLSDFEVLKGIGQPADQMALDVVKKMPAWSPGHQTGTPVRMRMVIPIRFSL